MRWLLKFEKEKNQYITVEEIIYLELKFETYFEMLCILENFKFGHIF